jgi:NTE family protein
MIVRRRVEKKTTYSKPRSESVSDEKQEDSIRVALALGSGAAWGFAHIGVLEALREQSIEPVAVAGTSMGSIIGALIAVGMSVDEMRREAERIDLVAVARLFAPTISASGIVNGTRLVSFLERLIGDPLIEDLPIPYRAVGYDLLTGEQVVFDRGPLLGAIRASVSVPVVFAPVCSDGQTLIDGGLVDPVPVEVARRLSRSIKIIAVNVLQAPERLSTVRRAPGPRRVDITGSRPGQLLKRRVGKRHARAPSILEILLRTLAAGQAEIAHLRLEASPPDLLIHPRLPFMSPADFHQARRAISAGRSHARCALTPAVRQSLTSPCRSSEMPPPGDDSGADDSPW